MKKYFLFAISLFLLACFSSIPVLGQNNLIPDSLDCNATRPEFSFDIKKRLESTDGVSKNCTPIAGDIDGDGKVEILAVGFSGNILVFDGQSDPNVGIIQKIGSIVTATNRDFSTPYAMCDVEGDGKAEILVVNAIAGSATLYSVSSAVGARPITFAQRWTVNLPGVSLLFQGGVVPFVADLDGDGAPEFIAERYIIETNGVVKATTPNFRGTMVGSSYMCISYAVDLDNNGIPEIVAGTDVFKYNGSTLTLWKRCPSYPSGWDGTNMAADINLDGKVDLVYSDNSSSAAGNIVVWTPSNGANGTVVGTISGIPSGFRCYPVVGDIDAVVTNGKKYPEICYNGHNYLRAYSFNGTSFYKKWDLPTNENSGLATFTFFDFNLDGIVELVYRDERNLHIYDCSGATPIEKYSMPAFSGTLIECPIVADVTGDGSANIVVTGAKDSSPTSPGFLYVFEGLKSKWASCPSVWNQQLYSPLLINRDLTVTQHVESPIWKRTDCNNKEVMYYNGGPMQAPFISERTYCPIDLSSDVYVVSSTLKIIDATTAKIDVTLGNKGMKPVLASTPIRFYQNSISTTNILTSASTTLGVDLAIGQTVTISKTINSLSPMPTKFYVRALDDGTNFPALGTYSDCNLTNNVKSFGTLELTKTVNAASSCIDGTSIFTVKLVNNTNQTSSPVTFSNIIITDSLGMGFDYLSATSATGTITTFDNLTHKLQWTIPLLGHRDSVILVYKAKAVAAGANRNTAWVESINGTPSPREAIEAYVIVSNQTAPAGATISPTGISRVAPPATSILLTATASGAISYQWYKDGVEITGATSSTYTVTEAGNYGVTYFNGTCVSQMSAEKVVFFGPDIFEIWNWQDLSQVPTMRAQGITNFKVMQNIGIPGDAESFGDGTGAPADHTGNKKYGWYGYKDNANAWTGTYGWNAAGKWVPYSLDGFSLTFIFDGNHKTISGLTVVSQKNTGLFSELRDGVVKNIRLAKVDINVSAQNVGGIAGYIKANTTITACAIESGNIVSSLDNVGGIVGHIYGNWTGPNNFGNVTQSYNAVTVSGSANVGGIVGYSISSAIYDSYNLGNITATTGAAGGIIGGSPRATNMEFVNLYNAGRIASGGVGDETGVGAIIGSRSQFYYWGGILFDTITSNVPRAIGYITETGLPGGLFSDPHKTADLLKQTTYATAAAGTFDFTSIWAIDEGYTYPYLQWQKSATPADNAYTVTKVEYSLNNGASWKRMPSPTVTIPTAQAVKFRILNNNAVKSFNPAGGNVVLTAGATSNEFTVTTKKANEEISIGAISKSNIVGFPQYADVSGIFEIWNWEDLSQVPERQSEGYTKFAVMQNIGTTVGTDAGNGYGPDGAQGTADDCPHDPSKWAGSYGYQNTTCGWDANGWKPIGDSTTQFSGVFYGQNYTIAGLWINRATTNYQGLFGSVQNSTIRDIAVKLEKTKGIKAQYYAGSLAGYMGNNTLIDHCQAIGNLTAQENSGILIGMCGNLSGPNTLLNDTVNACFAQGNITGVNHLGGLIGTFVSTNTSSSLVVTNSHSKGHVNCSEGYGGGLIGRARIAKISTSYSNTDVKSGDDNRIGGFTGFVTACNIKDCYSTGSVTGTPRVAYSMGGFASEWVLAGVPSTYTNCYSIGAVLNGNEADGGFLGAGQSNVTLTNCYFNTETSFKEIGSPNVSIHGTAQAMNTAQMTANLPAGFDPAIWEIVPGETYPYLKWQAARGLSNTYQVTGVTYSVNGRPDKPYGGPCVKLTNNVSENVVFKVTNDNSERVYLSYNTDVFYSSGTVSTTPLTLPKTNQYVSIGFASESDIIGVRAPAAVGATLMGTVFPYIYDTISDGTPDTEFNKLFPVIANLYAVPPVTTNDPIADINNSTPLYTDTSIYYDGTIFVPGTPKNPGKIGLTNNPGLPINWSALGKIQGTVDATTLIQGEIPSSSVGLYVFDNVTPGDYVLALSRPGYVTRFTKITVNTDTILGHRELIGGDVNNDLFIDPYDISKINAKRSEIGTPNYDPHYDINASGIIDVFDISLVLFYYGFYFEMYNDTWDWLIAY